jgi:hypothetical protein
MMKRYNALFVGENSGLLSSSDDPYPNSPEHYERTIMVREDEVKAEIEQLRHASDAAANQLVQNADLIEKQQAEIKRLNATLKAMEEERSEFFHNHPECRKYRDVDDYTVSSV